MNNLKNDWEFIFLAANQDAMKTASKLNIKSGNSMNFVPDSEGTREVYSQMSASVKSYRSSNSKFSDNMMNGNNEYLH